MPPQSVEIAETIAALKRALKREKEAPSDKQIASATNRGNKLKKGASSVHAGSLPYKHTQSSFKERIVHAGYQRYILNRNPKRYNEYGDELEDSESDAEADADAEDENPYGDIRLEELLRPLTFPAELESHPTMSQTYIDPAIPDMVLNTEEKLRHERANLWRAKNLFRQFVGDESWMPCGSVEQTDDWDLFHPLTQESTKLTPGKKRKRGNDEELLQNGIDDHDQVEHSRRGSEERGEAMDTTMHMEKDHIESHADQEQDTANSKVDEDNLPETNGDESATNDVEMKDSAETKANGISHKEKQDVPSSETDTEVPQAPNGDTKEEEPASDNNKATNEDGGTEADADAEADAEETPPPPTSRRITRALAVAATNTSNTATPPPLSPSSSAISTIDSLLLEPHPIFLLPPRLQISHTTHHSNLPLHVAHSGLPIDEIIDTRRLLGMYIQKQEETIRGLEAVLGKLIKAKRQRDQVWEWCKAEGHVGEWSDGEDWVDTEAWGINPDELKKGKDDDNNEEEDVGGRKGKRRRAREKE